MKTVFLSLVLCIVAFSAFVEAAPVNARYVKFEGYYTSNTNPTQQFAIYEIEAYSGGLNAAKTSTVTANSVSGSNTSYLKDGNTAGAVFYSSRTSPGPASEVAPHWVQMDLGSVMPIDRIKIYFFSSYQNTFGIFLSSDGTNWTQVGRYDLATGTIENDPSAPWVTIESAAMRPGTTLMDVVYRVRDVDDVTVKTRALAFVNGVRSFANVLKPVTFAEGTAANLGDAIAVNQSHTLTWNVATDWEIDLGQVKFEVLAMDGRGLLPFEWIAIPAAGGHPQTTVSKNSPTNAEVLNALFWQYASGDTGLSLANGILSGNASNGVFNNVALANGSTLQAYATPFIFKRMNLDIDDNVVATAARAGLTTPTGWHAANRTYAGVKILSAWGSNSQSQATIPASQSGVITAVKAGCDFNLALRGDGTVVGWGYSQYGQTTIPVGLSGVTAIAVGVSPTSPSLALKSDGTVVAWGNNQYGQVTGTANSVYPNTSVANPVTFLTGVTAIAVGGSHSLALKSDGTVVGWGNNQNGQVTGTANTISPYTSVANPVTLVEGVTAIAAGGAHSLALKSDRTVVGWGQNNFGQTTIPAGLSDVIAIVAGGSHSLALKSDGTVVAWGNNNYGQRTVPVGLNGVVAIAAGSSHSLALKSDGTVVGWGYNQQGQVTGTANTVSPFTSIANPVSFLTGISAISAGSNHSIALKTKAP
jgi:Regulator of chromosome condensation (RCC1) repeat/F5/8 type C domain